MFYYIIATIASLHVPYKKAPNISRHESDTVKKTTLFKTVDT